MTHSLRPGSRAPALAALTVLTALAVGAVTSACDDDSPATGSSRTSSASVVASGGAWAPPRLTYPTPLDATTRRTDVLWEGVGPTVKKGDVVVLDTYAEDGRSRKVVANSFAGAPRVARAEPKTLGSDLYRLVAGRAAGTRLLDVQKSGGVPLATTIDVLAGRAVGAPLPQGKGEPVVTRASDGEPHITVPKGAKAPTQLATLPLVHGTGPQVEAGQQVTVQFTGVTWADGKVFDTTWGSDRLPVTVTLGVGDVIEGWDEGLIELPVGSEVMLIVPPDLAYQGTDSKLADQTLVYVVDILDAHTPGTPPKPGSVVTPQPVPSTGGTATKSADPSS